MKLNGYVFQARIIPAIIILLPMIIETNYILIKLNYKLPISISIANLVLLCFLIVFSNWVRYFGRKNEKKLFAKWGGPPTTRFLRLNNKEFNSALKWEVRRSLKFMFTDLKMPSEELEKTYPQVADEIYEAYVCNLRSLTRNIDEYKLLYIENKNYGMWRNMYSIKLFSIIICSILFAVNIVFPIFLSGFFNWFECIILDVTFILYIIIYFVVVTESKVKDVANCYAERLFETVIVLDKNNVKAKRS